MHEIHLTSVSLENIWLAMFRQISKRVFTIAAALEKKIRPNGAQRKYENTILLLQPADLHWHPLSGNHHFLSGHQIISLYFNANSSFPKNIPNLSHFTPSLQFNPILILSYNTTLSEIGPNSVQSGESSIEVEGSGEIITIISREFSLQGEEDKMKCFCFLQDRLDGLSLPATAGRDIFIRLYLFLSWFPQPRHNPYKKCWEKARKSGLLGKGEGEMGAVSSSLLSKWLFLTR